MREDDHGLVMQGEGDEEEDEGGVARRQFLRGMTPAWDLLPMTSSSTTAGGPTPPLLPGGASRQTDSTRV